MENDLLIAQTNTIDRDSMYRQKDYKHHSSASSLMELPHHSKSRGIGIQNQKTMILQLNLNSNSSSCSNLLGITNNGYTQRNIERKNYSKLGLDLIPYNRTNELDNSLKSLHHSKSEIYIMNSSVVSGERLLYKNHLAKITGNQKQHESLVRADKNKIGTLDFKNLKNRSSSHLYSTRSKEVPKMDVKIEISKNEDRRYYTSKQDNH